MYLHLDALFFGANDHLHSKKKKIEVPCARWCEMDSWPVLQRHVCYGAGFQVYRADGHLQSKRSIESATCAMARLPCSLVRMATCTANFVLNEGREIALGVFWMQLLVKNVLKMHLCLFSDVFLYTFEWSVLSQHHCRMDHLRPSDARAQSILTHHTMCDSSHNSVVHLFARRESVCDVLCIGN